MISKTLSGFSRSALRIFSRSLMTPDSIFLLTDFPLLRLVHTWRKANLRMRSFNPLLSYDIAKYHAPVALLVIPCPAPPNCGDRSDTRFARIIAATEAIHVSVPRSASSQAPGYLTGDPSG
jgi:hypothetical protein